MSTRIRTAQTAVSALLVLSAGAAAAQTPPLPSLDGVNSISSGTLPNAASGGNGVVRTSGGSTGLPVIVTVDGTTANIQTAAHRSVIDWQSFNIGEGHRVNFLLPDRASVAVNRVRGVGADFASRIDGDLWSNGNVWLLNPNGVFFGATARVDVAGLLATPAGLRNLDDLIGVDGTFQNTSTVRFNMPGSSFPTEVTTPGPVSVAAGAEILVRGGPAMFIVGSGVQGRTLTVGGTVTSRSSDLVRGVLTPPGVFDSNGDYGSLPTDSDPAEEISSQVVYAASGDFALTMIERAIDEPSPPNPLSSNDLDLFEFTVERGFAGRQIENDQMAPEAILIEHTAKTVAGQVVVRAAAEASALLRRYDPRDDLGDNLGCDPQLDSCTINRNPDHDTYLYDPQTDSHQFVCAAGPADEACGTINGTETSNGFTYLAYLGVETTQSPDYGCAECAPGIRIRSSLLALDPRTSSRDYGASLLLSLDIDASPSFGFLDNLVITRDANGRPVETVVSADSQAVSVVLDPRDAPSRQFDFGAGGGGLQQVALELVSAGELSLRGRDVCATFTGLCFQQGVIYRSSDLYTAPRVNLRLQSAFGSSITADRLLRLEETFLDDAVLQLAGGNQSSGGGNSGPPAPLRQMVLRNARLDPRAGFIISGGDVDPARIVVGTAANATNDVTLGQIFGGEGLDVDIDVFGMLRIINTFVTSPGDPLPGYVSAGNISLKGRGISVGELEIKDYTVEDDGIHALTLLSRATDPAKFSFGRISAFAPKSQVSITSAAKLEFDPLDKFNTSALPDNLRLASTGGALCVGVTDSGGCSVADLDLAGSIELRGQLGIEVGAVTAGGEALLRAAAGSVAARDVKGARVDIQAGTKTAPPAGSDPWTEGEGVFTARIGDITARDGTVLLLGRDGIEAGDVSQARVDAPTPQVAEVELRSKSGSIVAGTLESLGADPAVGGKLKVETAQGALISLAAVTAGEVDVRADAGKVRIGIEDDGFAAGAVAARSGRVSLEGREGVEAGALTATTQVNVGAGSGSVVVGNVSAGGTASAAGPCDGKAVCLGAGFDGVDGSGRTLTTGTVSASVGEVLMDGRDGVTTGGAVTAGAGRVEIRSASGIVDTRAGTVTAGTSAGAHDAKITGNSLNLGDVAARRDIDLAATGADGGLATGVLTAGRALKVTGVASVGIGAAQIGGTPQSVQLSSTEGSVCLGALVNGTCTGQALTKDTDLTLQGKTGVTAGDLAVRSVLVDSSQGALILGDVTATDGKLALYGRTGVTAGNLTQARTGTPPTAPNIDLLSIAGAVTVGDITGTGLLYGRSSGLMSIGTVGGVKDIDLQAGGTLTAGTIAAAGFVQLQSVDGSLDLQGITAGAAKDAPDTDPCKGSAICLRAGEGATSGVQDIDTGALAATAGDILVRGRSAVTVGSAEAATGAVVLRAFEGTLTAGAVTAGRYIDIESSSGSVSVGALTAAAAQSSSGDDPCNGTSVCVQAGAATPGGTQSATVGTVKATAGAVLLAARNGLTLAGVAATAGGITAKGGSGAVTATGALTAGTGASTDADHDIVVEGAGLALQGVRASGDLALSARTGVTAGDLGAKSLQVSVSEGAVAVGDVTASDGTMLLQGRTGITAGTLTQARSGSPLQVPDIDLIADGGSIAVGAVSGSGSLRGRALDDLSVGTVTGVDAVDLSAGKALTASGAITSRGFVELRSDTGSMAVQAVTAGAAKQGGSTDPCAGKAICVRAGEGAGTGTQTLTAGQLTASTGALFVRGRSGVTAGDVRAEGGVLDIGAAAGGVTLGAVRGSGAVTVTARDALSAGDVVGATGVAGDVVMSSADGALTVKSVTAGTSTVLSSVDLRSKGDLGVTAGGTTRGNIVASGGARLESGAALRVGDVTATQDVRVTAQGALSAGAVRSSDAAVTLTARDGVATGDLNATDVTVTATGGDISLGGATARTLTVNAAAGQAGAGDVRLGGAVTLAPAAGTPAGATPALRVQAARDITVAGAVTSERNVAFSAGRNFANSGAIRVTAGTAADGNGAAGYGGIDIRAADAEIGAPLQARGAGVNLLATGGGIALGDGITAPSGAMRISDAELQSIDAPTAALRSAVSSTAGRDILVGDITLDRARIGELLLATRQGGKVRVTGTVRGTGAPAMRIGETGMRPDTIEVSGALGTLAAPIGALQLRSAGHILFGPQTFIDAANAAQDILAFDVAAASQGATPGRLFLVSAATSFDTPRAILQQNTGPSLRDGDGIRIGAPAGNITATFATDTPPQRIELFGRVVDAQGNVTSAQQASLVAGLLPGGTASNAVWRLNTCVIGSGAGCAGGDLLPPPSTLLQSPLPLPPVPVPGNGGDDGDPGTAGGGGGSTDDDDDADGPRPVPQLADAGSSAEEQRILPLEVDPGSRDLLRPADDGAVREPGVGSANEDLWPQGALPQ